MTLSFQREQLAAYFVCGTQDVPDQDLESVVQTALDSGITAFQYRDKGASRLTAAERLALGARLHDRCRAANVPFIVDDDVELALALEADGIHVGQKDDRVTTVLNRVGGKMFVGLSCSTVAEIEVANQIAGIAYIGSGPIFPTTSKADADPVIGLAGLTELVRVAKRPIVAIGGITEAQLANVTETGAAGSAVISMIAKSTDIARTVTAMQQAAGGQYAN
ncbi:thiamine phosphate synthase [Lactiplantibacillus plajomi]|uniref:Thiamine-phosphate synthase n=1 Tax=Lactiplantibacillus plajomi TaxID=1457217 RepID=A0ABV6K664_9LACO|nr:thiamine phosphate synthase [Lactiplantibacillus plajomi]